MQDYCLKVENIKKSFGKKNVLSDISFELHTGECIGIVGMNGSGKTTLFNIIYGETKANSGNISLMSTDNVASIIHNRKLINSHIGYIPQENMLIEDLSALDNLKLWYCDSKLNLSKELESGFLHTLGIDTFLHTKVNKLSGGMQKRLSIGTALATMPYFMILDEPCAALDLVAKNIIRSYIRSYKAYGGILIATHDEEDMALCDRLFTLKNGVLTKIPPTIRGEELIQKIL